MSGDLVIDGTRVRRTCGATVKRVPGKGNKGLWVISYTHPTTHKRVSNKGTAHVVLGIARGLANVLNRLLDKPDDEDFEGDDE